MTQPRKPRREKRAKPLPFVMGHTPGTHIALQPFDRRAEEADRKWGIDRLPECASPETAAKYGAALDALNVAIKADDLPQIAAHVANCIKGIDKMEAEAVAAGKQPMPASAIETEYNGRIVAIVNDARDLQFYNRRPDAITYTAREIAIALEWLAKADGIAAAKAAFPNAEMTNIRAKPLPDEFWENGGDEICL